MLEKEKLMIKIQQNSSEFESGSQEIYGSSIDR